MRAAFLVLLLAGCLEQAPTQVAFRDLAKGAMSGVVEAQDVVVRGSVAWDALWRRHATVWSPAPETPQVDFGREVVLGTFVGEQGSGCWATEIEAVERLPNGTVRVTVGTHAPDLRDTCTAEMTQPFHLVAAARPDGAFWFAHEAR